VTKEVITNGQRAVAAFAAINTYTKASEQPARIISPNDTELEARLAQDRLSRLLCALRHHADRVSGLSFDEMLNAAREDSDLRRCLCASG
jgi:hypothetical protein